MIPLFSWTCIMMTVLLSPSSSIGCCCVAKLGAAVLVLPQANMLTSLRLIATKVSSTPWHPNSSGRGPSTGEAEHLWEGSWGWAWPCSHNCWDHMVLCLKLAWLGLVQGGERVLLSPCEQPHWAVFLCYSCQILNALLSVVWAGGV